jgi:hypothetical protein
VVAGNGIERHGERREDLAQERVLLGPPEVDQVSGQQDDVGAGVEGVEMRDAVPELLRRIDLPIGRPAA